MSVLVDLSPFVFLIVCMCGKLRRTKHVYPLLKAVTALYVMTLDEGDAVSFVNRLV
jgi:hypothetical protein